MAAVHSFNCGFHSKTCFTQRRKDPQRLLRSSLRPLRAFAPLRGTFFQGVRDTSDLVNRYLI